MKAIRAINQAKKVVKDLPVNSDDNSAESITIPILDVDSWNQSYWFVDFHKTKTLSGFEWKYSGIR